MNVHLILTEGGARGEIRLFDMATAKTIVTVEDLHLGERASLFLF